MDIKPTPTRLDGPAIKNFTSREIKIAIDKLNPRKAPGIDSITTRPSQEAPKKALVLFTGILNAILHLPHFPKPWKTAKVVVIPKPGKPLENPESHRPISLLVTISKLFEKLFSKRLSSLVLEFEKSEFNGVFLLRRNFHKRKYKQ